LFLKAFEKSARASHVLVLAFGKKLNFFVSQWMFLGLFTSLQILFAVGRLGSAAFFDPDIFFIALNL
jgi:hypothetical protein